MASDESVQIVAWFEDGFDESMRLHGASLFEAEMVEILEFPDGSLGLLPSGWLDGLVRLARPEATGGGSSLWFGRSDLWILARLLEAAPDPRVDLPFAELRNRLASATAPGPVPALVEPEPRDRPRPPLHVRHPAPRGASGEQVRKRQDLDPRGTPAVPGALRPSATGVPRLVVGRETPRLGTAPAVTGQRLISRSARSPVSTSVSKKRGGSRSSARSRWASPGGDLALPWLDADSPPRAGPFAGTRRGGRRPSSPGMAGNSSGSRSQREGRVDHRVAPGHNGRVRYPERRRLIRKCSRVVPLLGKGMAEKGRVPVLPRVWMANAAVAVLGVFLLWRILRR